MNVSKKEEDDKIFKIMAERLGKRRSKLNISQEQLAKKIGMDRANYTKIENGDTGRKLRFSQLIKIAKELNVSLDYIFGLIDEDSPNVTIKEIYREYGLTEESLNIIKSTVNDNCSDVFNNFLRDFAVFDLTCRLKAFDAMNKIIKEDLIFLHQLYYFEEYILKNKNNKNEIRQFFNLFEKKISNIKDYNELCIEKDNFLKVYSYTWCIFLPTLQKEEATIIELFDEIKKSLIDNDNDELIREKIHKFTNYIWNILKEFRDKREQQEYHLIKSFTNNLNHEIPKEEGELYYRELEKYDEDNCFFSADEIKEIKKKNDKSKIIDTGIIKL